MIDRIVKTIWIYAALTASAMAITAIGLATVSGLAQLSRYGISLSVETIVLYGLCTIFAVLLALIPIAQQRGVQMTAEAVFIYRVLLAVVAGGIGGAFVAAVSTDDLNPALQSSTGLLLFFVVYIFNPARFLSAEERSDYVRHF